jgi:hypothetical protein
VPAAADGVPSLLRTTKGIYRHHLPIVVYPSLAQATVVFTPRGCAA